MPRRKVKVEFDDGDGGKYSISLGGYLTKEKVLRVMDLVELLGAPEPELQISDETTAGRLHKLIDKRFPLGIFGSGEVLEAYEDEYNQPVKLATISTYLSRFTDQGVLHRTKTGANWSYRRIRINASNHR